MTQAPVLHLASTSPRRREILSALRLEFSVAKVDVDETPEDGETPEDMVLRLAIAKAEAGVAGTGSLVLAADTAVVVDGRAMGKPVDEADCLAMLGALSGRGHEVLTGVALRGPNGTSTVLSKTDVYFREIICIENCFRQHILRVFLLNTFLKPRNFSSNGIPGTPQHTDTHPCTRPPSGCGV